MKKFLLSLMMVLMLATPAFAKDDVLMWDASPTPEVLGYIVCYDTDTDFLQQGIKLPAVIPPPECLDVGNVLTHTFYNMDDGTQFFYGVVAYDDVGNESAISNIVYSRSMRDPAPAGNAHGHSKKNNRDIPFENVP